MSHVWAFVVGPRFVSFLFISHFYFFSSTVYFFHVRHTISNVVTALTHNEAYCSVAKNNRLTGYEPKFLDNFDFSETSAMIFLTKPAIQIGSLRTRAMRNSTMRLLEKRYLHHCWFRSENNQRTWDKFITFKKKVWCQLFFRPQARRDLETNLDRAKNENHFAKRRTKESGFSLKDKSEFSLKSELRSRSTNLKPILLQEVSRNWMELLSLSEGKLITRLQVEEVKRFQDQESRVDEFREEDWSKIRTLFMNSRPEFRNYWMKSNVWMTREIVKMLNQYAVVFPTFPVNRRYFHLIVILVNCSAAMIRCMHDHHNTACHKKGEFWNLSEDVQPRQACDDAGFLKNLTLTLSNTSLWQRTTFIWQVKAVSQPEGAIRGITQIGTILGVMVTKRYDSYDIEIKIDSLNMDEVQSSYSLWRSVCVFVVGLADQTTKTKGYKFPFHWSMTNTPTKSRTETRMSRHSNLRELDVQICWRKRFSMLLSLNLL